MRESLVRWLVAHGLPGWLAPNYFVMVGLSGFIGAAISLKLARRDRADVTAEGRALMAGYVAAIVGGYLFEGLRAVPHAIAQGSVQPFFHVGRAAYGGLMGGLIGAVLVLRHYRAPVRPFWDRLVPLLGIVYAFVRTGCFLAGCDYGRVTAGPLGVRFPGGSPASMDHAAAGWIPDGAQSLPVHPTQLYEAGVGAIASIVASIWLARGYRDGRAFATWIAAYAVGRFLIEFIRGDSSRGIYAGLSSAQFVSLGLLCAVGIAVLRSRRSEGAARVQETSA